MMELSDQQKTAVEHTGSPALVIAGAGAGKTRTLTAKIAHLILNGYDPGRILAITFTNKAAGEMKSRLVQLTGMVAERFPWVRTYHSACFEILKTHCFLLGYGLPLQIYAGYQQRKLLGDIMEGLNFKKKIVPVILGQISNAKNSGNPGQYFDQRPNMAHIRLIDVYALYETELKKRNAVDFDNILVLTRNLLRDHADVRQKYQKFFQFILVDEYQDSNNLQEELTRLLLSGPNLFCVGDDWQAIYGFRGSNVKHFLTFKKQYHDARIFRLEKNYRSSDEIVQVANHLIGYNEDKMDKKCYAERQGGVVELHDFFNEDEEAGWVCKKIRVLRDMGIPYDKIAVLYRTKFCSLAFEKAFRYVDIPYRMLGAKGFFERKEILDINSYLAASVFPKDDVSFERVMNTPKRGIGPATIKKIGSMRTGNMSLQDAVRKALDERVLASGIHKKMKDLISIIDEIRDQEPQKAIQVVLSKSSYFDYLRSYSKTDEAYISRVENIEELIYTASQKQTLLNYLEEASLVREDREDNHEDGLGVNLSTIHASKGLEYSVVFIVGCVENLFPHWKSKESESELQEERRLMYVAITRAAYYLYICYSSFRKGQPAAKSRFIEEIESAAAGF